jgi:hypothetical protein
MDELIAKANIEHVEKLLASETDAHKCRVLENVLAEEKSKLAAALKRRDERRELIERPPTRASASVAR